MRSIAITGGPGAGKTSLIAALLAAYPDTLVAVPEVATLLLRHIFPGVENLAERRAFQRTIFAVQRNLEDTYGGRLSPGQVLLCDRGTPDGGGYWPEGDTAFFHAMHSDRHIELSRYDAVLFLETAAAGGHSILQGNEVRHEDLATAVAIDRRLFDVWSSHATVEFVAQTACFADKIARGVELVGGWLTTNMPAPGAQSAMPTTKLIT